MRRFKALLGDIGIGSALPDACASVTAEALAASMKSPANFGMSQNAACDLSEADLDAFATAMIARVPEVRATA